MPARQNPRGHRPGRLQIAPACSYHPHSTSSSPRQNRSLISEQRELAWLELVHTPVVPKTEQSISSPAHHGGGTTYGPDVPKKRLSWDSFQSPNSAFNKKNHLQLAITSIYQHISIWAEAMLSDGEQQEVLLGYDWADWTHHGRETAVYTALSEGFFLQLFSTSFRGKKKKFC